MNKLLRFIGIVLSSVLLVATSVSVATAQISSSTTVATSNPNTWLTIVPLDCQDADGCDICEVTKVFTNAATLIGSVLSGLALLMFVIGGLFLIFSAGNESRVETGKKILVGTVTGLAIVFLAWLAVNVVVRTSALSGGSGTNTIFSKNWWELKGCYPQVFAECKGHFIGESCGNSTGAECTASTTDTAKCACYRYLDPKAPNGTQCEGDTDNNVITSVGQGATNKDKQCGCFTGCTILKDQTGQNYTCVSADTVTRANNASTTDTDPYIVNTSASCVLDSEVCALSTN